ncbi:MAG: hypothetical protein H6909_05020 [Rickettsiaceae bacterium]|nr:hypothetical protein [Rickettsiaceae bacterium]
MSLTFIHDFQKTIYNTLILEQKLTNLINKIYIGPALNVKAPFITVHFNKLEDISQFQRIIYNIEFIISVYIQETYYYQLSNIADIVIDNILKIRHLSVNCQVIGIKLSTINFIDARDSAIHKADIHFKSSIAKK